jgi:hypothetical protein
MSQPPEPDSTKAKEKPLAATPDAPKKMRPMTRKAFGELLKRVITKPTPKST